MTLKLNLSDIQGNVTRGYGRFSFPKARYVFFRVDNPGCARRFVGEVNKLVTTATRWGDDFPKPEATTNIAFTFNGLKAIGLPTKSLLGFPPVFIEGMKHRRAILGDDGPSGPEFWDNIWQKDQDVHIWISINARSLEAIEERYALLIDTMNKIGGVTQLAGHKGDDGDDMLYQEGSAVYVDGAPTGYEHFGYLDGIGQPVFEGQDKDSLRVLGRGRLNNCKEWIPLRAGEFILGHVNEGGEYPTAPWPNTLSRNSTFMVYRKLHQNVGSFEKFLSTQAESFPGGKELLAAKISGRWRKSGAPIVHTPDEESLKQWMAKFEQASADEKDKMLIDFTYNEDIPGSKCPVTAHIRRINPRSSLQFGHIGKDCKEGAFSRPGALVDNRRLLRRGLPYGEVKNPDNDDGNHGIVFITINARIDQQFEFVQQQWINYANDFKHSNDKDVLLGNHDNQCPGRFIIQAEPGSGKPPHILSGMKRFVETRGGDYFFLPSMTALDMIAAGTVDPT